MFIYRSLNWRRKSAPWKTNYLLKKKTRQLSKNNLRIWPKSMIVWLKNTANSRRNLPLGQVTKKMTNCIFPTFCCSLYYNFQTYFGIYLFIMLKVLILNINIVLCSDINTINLSLGKTICYFSYLEICITKLGFQYLFAYKT